MLRDGRVRARRSNRVRARNILIELLFYTPVQIGLGERIGIGIKIRIGITK